MQLIPNFKRYIAAEVGAAIATGIGALASSGLNAYSQHKTNAVNRAQAEYAFRQQQQAIQRQNEYNSPAQQVLRMKAAGLNPALAYGANGEMVGNQADIPAYNAIPAEAPNLGNIGTGLAEAVRTGIDIRDLQRREALAVSEIALQGSQQFLATTAGELNQAQKQEIVTMLGYKVEEAESRIQLNWENVLKTRQEISNLKAQKKEILSRIGVNEEQMKLLAAQCGLTEMQAYRLASLLPHEIVNMDANTALQVMQTSLSQEQILSIDRDMMHINFVERLENQKFDFEKGKLEVEAAKWEKEYRADRIEHFTDNLIRIYTFGVGAAALRKGEQLPPVRRAPITSSHHGVGANYTPSKPKRHPAPGTKY